MFKMKISFISFLILISSPVSAAVVVSTPTKINEINSYANFPDGDTLFTVDTPHSSCPIGYWLLAKNV